MENSRVITFEQVYKNINMTDDRFFKLVLKSRQAGEEMLRVLTGDPELRIVNIKLPRKLAHDNVRAVILDFLCLTGTGKFVAIEMQKRDTGDHIRRVRRIIGSIDVKFMKKNSKFEEMPDVCAIFLSDFDFIKSGKALNIVERKFAGTDISADNGTTEIYANTAVDDNTLAAALMKLIKTGISDPRFPKLSRRIKLLKKSEKGKKAMLSLWDQHFEQVREEALTEGRAEGRAEGEAKGIMNTLIENIRSLMETTNVTLKKAMDLLRVPDEKRPQIIAALS